MNEIDESRKRSGLRTLHIFLVISFIVSGYHLLAYLVMGVTPSQMKEQMVEMAGGFPDEFAIMLDKFLAIPQWYFLVSALLNVASIVGLVLMWKVRGSGFHCYTLSKLMLILMPVMFLDRSYIAIGDIMIAILFIIYYFALLRILGAFSNENNVTNVLPEENRDTGADNDNPGGEN